MSHSMRFARGPDAEPTSREEGLISRYLMGELAPKRALAVERRLLNDAAFHRRVTNSLQLHSFISCFVLPSWKETGSIPELSKYGDGPSDRFEAQIVRALERPGEASMSEVLEQVQRDAAGNGRLGRFAVEAVRRRGLGQRLTVREADAIVLHVAGSMRSDVEQVAGLLLGLDEQRLARMLRKKGEPLLHWASGQIAVLQARIGTKGRDWTLDYPSWSEDDADAVVRVGRDKKLEAIRRDRDEGTVPACVAWAMLHLRAVALVSDRLMDDVVYGEIIERLDDLALAGLGPVDPGAPVGDETVSSEWRVLSAARDRRIGVFTRHVLRAAGEDEMVRVLVERPEEYQRRVDAWWTELAPARERQ